MSERFGHRFQQFSWAVDIVDENMLEHVLDLLIGYVSRNRDLAYWALLIEGEVNNSPGLHAYKCSQRSNIAFAIKNQVSYTNLAAYAFAETKKLWIVSPDTQPLGPDTHLRDYWSGAEHLPPYEEERERSIRTVIMIPLRWKGRTFGVLDLQMNQCYEPTNRAQQELALLVETLSELLYLSETNKIQRANTWRAIEMLRRVLEQESWPPLGKPQIFVASSNRADQGVIGTIREVLDEFKDSLQVYYWAASSDTGNINRDILAQVKRSQFGLCYFSEPEEGTEREFKYQDNANVVFEAGMFQSLTNPDATDDLIGWIPVRELKSPPPPFDFAQQRMIVIPRLGDNKLNKEKLRYELKARIEKLLKPSEKGAE